MTQLYYPQYPINYPTQPSIKSSSEMEELLMQLHFSSMKLDLNQKPTTVNTQSAAQPSTSPRSPSSEFARYAGGAFEQSPEPENLPLPSFIKKRLELSKSADSVSGPTSFSSESLSASDEELCDTPLSHSQTRSPSHSGRRSKRARSPYKGFSPARSNKSQQQH
jgi:hypothetical protein